MSFTLEVKNELININTDDICCRRAMFAGIISFGGSIRKSDYIFSTENIAVAELITDLASQLFGLKTRITAKEASYSLTVYGAETIFHALGIYLGGLPGFHIPSSITSDCCLRAYARGAFIGGGSVMSPEKRYHLEFVTPHYSINNEFQKIFMHFDIPSKSLVRKSRYVTYFKDNEIICDVLAMIGAGNAVLEVSNTNIAKSLKNRNNRRVNCETANVVKTINAAVNQVMAIEKIKSTTGLESLPPALEELARLRLEYNDLSLSEIAKMMHPPLSKSGVNHRMRRIIKIAEGDDSVG